MSSLSQGAQFSDIQTVTCTDTAEGRLFRDSLGRGGGVASLEGRGGGVAGLEGVGGGVASLEGRGGGVARLEGRGGGVAWLQSRTTLDLTS